MNHRIEICNARKFESEKYEDGRWDPAFIRFDIEVHCSAADQSFTVTGVEVEAWLTDDDPGDVVCPNCFEWTPMNLDDIKEATQ